MLAPTLSLFTSVSVLVARVLASSDGTLGHATQSPPVKVSLRSSWPAPNLLLEIM